MVEAKGRKWLIINADVRQRSACFDAVDQTLKEFGKLNIMINNAAFQKTEERLEDITEENLRRTLKPIFSATFLWRKPACHTSKMAMPL